MHRTMAMNRLIIAATMLTFFLLANTTTETEVHGSPVPVGWSRSRSQSYAELRDDAPMDERRRDVVKSDGRANRHTIDAQVVAEREDPSTSSSSRGGYASSSAAGDMYGPSSSSSMSVSPSTPRVELSEGVAANTDDRESVDGIMIGAQDGRVDNNGIDDDDEVTNDNDSGDNEMRIVDDDDAVPDSDTMAREEHDEQETGDVMVGNNDEAGESGSNSDSNSDDNEDGEVVVDGTEDIDDIDNNDNPDDTHIDVDTSLASTSRARATAISQPDDDENAGDTVDAWLAASRFFESAEFTRFDDVDDVGDVGDDGGSTADSGAAEAEQPLDNADNGATSLPEEPLDSASDAAMSLSDERLNNAENGATSLPEDSPTAIPRVQSLDLIDLRSEVAPDDDAYQSDSESDCCLICLESFDNDPEAEDEGRDRATTRATREAAAADLTTKLACGHQFHTSCIERWHRGRCTCPACRAVSRPPRTVHEWVAIKKPLLQALSEELRHRNTLLFQVLRADAMPASRTPTSTLAHYRAIERMLDTRRRAVEQAVTLVPIARSEYHRMYVTFFQNRRKWLQLATLIEGYERDYREEDERVMKALRKEIARLEREVEDVCDEGAVAVATANADAQEEEEEEEEEGVQEASTLNLMDAPLAPLESPTSPESPTSLPPPPERPTFTSFFLSRFRLPTLGHKRRRYNCNHSSTVQRPPPQPPTLLESMRYNRRRRRILNGYKELRHLWSDMHSVTWELVKAMQLRRGP